ncbi:hypothetical protein BH23PAT1_BH23PAT1_0980 [soil metagenome]
MDFLNPKKKRAHRIRLFIGYGLMAVLIGLAATMLLFEASGFDVDRRTGEVTHNGLVFVDAHPETADVYLNGKRQGQTDMRLVIPEGDYEISLSRDGYRSWERKFRLQGGHIERFVYPFLFPEKLVSEDVRSYESAPRLATQSPDRRWLVVQKSDDLSEFEINDLNSKEVKVESIKVPDGVFSSAAGAHKLEAIEWSTNNRHLLLKHNFNGSFEFVIIDMASPVNSLNLTKLFNTPFTDMALRDKRPDRFYLLDKTSGRLQQADSPTGEITPLLSNVLAFRGHGDDMIVYVTSEDAEKGRVSVKIREGSDVYKLRELTEDTKYLIDLARFKNRWYFATGTSKDKRVYIYEDVLSTLRQPNELLSKPVPVSVLKAEKAEFLSFSANARFIVAQAGDKLAVYDAEADRTHHYNSQLKLSAGQKLLWMDGHRLLITRGDKVMVMDYDGTNKHELVEAHNGFHPFFDRDYERMFTISPSADKPAATSLSLTSMLATKQ